MYIKYVHVYCLVLIFESFYLNVQILTIYFDTKQIHNLFIKKNS